MSRYFPDPPSFGGRVKVKLGLSCYVTKADLKNATGIDTSSVAKKFNLSNSKSDVDKLDTGKLKKIQLI